MSARPRARSARTARTPRATLHRTPIGLQIVARAIHGHGWNIDHIKRQLQAADAHALRLLTDPISNFDRHGTLNTMDALARTFDKENVAKTITTAIPATATHDPEAWLTVYAQCHQDAGLYLGLCFGFRLAAGLGGKE